MSFVSSLEVDQVLKALFRNVFRQPPRLPVGGGETSRMPESQLGTGRGDGMDSMLLANATSDPH